MAERAPLDELYPSTTKWEPTIRVGAKPADDWIEWAYADDEPEPDPTRPDDGDLIDASEL